MIVFLNGDFLPEAEARISVHDRGFLYGDGLFETMRVYEGRPFRWDRHLQRFEKGAAFLGIPLAATARDLRGYAEQLIDRNSLLEGSLRLTLSRGGGARGYSIRDLTGPTLLMTVSPLAAALDTGQGWNLVTSSYRVPAGDPLSQVKSCCKLLQILARREAEERGAQEALIINTEGRVAEAAASNLFWQEEGTIYTPPLDEGLLPGVTRELTLELCAEHQIPAREKSITPAALQRVDGIFLTVSTLELIEVATYDSIRMPPVSRLAELRAAYREKIIRECGA